MSSSVAEGFLPFNERIVHSLYFEDHVLVPINSGGSLYAAAQKVARLGFDEFVRRQKEKIAKVSASIHQFSGD